MFHDPSWLVETLTHGSYSTMISTLGILGDVVLDMLMQHISVSNIQNDSMTT